MKQTTNQIGRAAIKLLVCFSLTAAGAAFGQLNSGTARWWTGAAGDYTFGTANNWTNSLGATGAPASGSGDIAIFDVNGLTGNIAGNVLQVTNSAGNNSNPGMTLQVTGNHTNGLSIVSTSSGQFRLGTNTLVIANGSGPVRLGNGGSTAFYCALALGAGNNNLLTNNSAYPATINSDVYWIMGGGNLHNITLCGSGDWLLYNQWSPQNAGSGGSSSRMVISGTGVVRYAPTNAPGISFPASAFSGITLNSGTFQLGNDVALSTLQSGAALTINGGNLDSSVADLVNPSATPQSWSGNFGFTGTESLNIGSGAVTMSASRIVTVSAKTLEVDGVISGSGYSLTKSGAGTLLLGGANTYSGGTVVSNGVLKLGNSSAIPSTGNVTVHGMLDLNANSATLINLSGAGMVDTVSGGAPTATVSNSTSSTFSGVIKNTSGSLTLTKNGSGTLTLSGASTYSGGTAVNAGSLVVNGSIGSGAVTVASGASLGGSGTIGGTVDWQSGSTGSFTLTPTTGAGSNSTPLTVSGSVTLNGNTITVNVAGGTPLGVGTYKLMGYNNTGSTGAFAAGSPAYTGAGVASGTASSVATSGGQVILTVIYTGLSTTWTNNGNGNWTTGANWSSNPTYPKDPGDAAFLGVGSAYTTVTLNSPISLAALTFTNANSFLVANAGNTLTMNNPFGSALITVNAGASNAIAPAVSLATNLTISSVSGTSLAITNVISNGSGNQALTINGAANTTVELSGANTYGPSAGSVGTTVSGGPTARLKLGNAAALGAGDLSFSGSTTVEALVPMTLANNFGIVPGFAQAGLDVSNNAVTLSGVVSGAGSLVKSGNGTLTLNNVNTFSNGLSINAGTVKLGNAAGIPSGVGSGDVIMGANTTVDLNGFNVVLNALGSSDASAVVDSSAGGTLTLSLGINGGSRTYLGTLKNSSGSLTLVKDGTGTQTLAGTNLLSGTTTINAGTLQLGNGGQTNLTGSGMAVGLGSGSVDNAGNLQFNLAGTNIFANQITGTGAVTLASASLNLWLTGNNASWTGPINFFGGNLWVSNSAGLGLGSPSKIIQPSNPNSTVHLDGSLGNLNIDSSIAFNLSGTSGVLFNEAGSNTIAGPVGLVFGNGNPYIKVNAGFLNLAGDVTAINPRALILGGAGNGQILGNYLEGGGGSLTKQDAGTWTLAGSANTYNGATTVNGGTLIVNGNLNGNGAIAVNSGGTMLLNGAYNGTGSTTIASGGTFGGVGTMFSPVTWQAGSTGRFTTSASGSTPMNIYNAVTLNNNAIIVQVDGGTPLPVGTYTLLSEPNVIYSISGSFATTPTITGAGIAAGTKAYVTTTTTEVKLTVVNSSVWTFNGNGNWTTGANWDSNPNFPNGAGQFATFGVGSSLITVNLNASETIGGISFTNANSFVITNSANTLALDNGGLGASVTVTAGSANSIATPVSLNDATTVSASSGTVLSLPGNISGGSALTLSGNGVLTLSGNNTYSGNTTMNLGTNGGTLVLASTNAVGSGTLTIAGGALNSTVPNLVNLNNNPQNWNGSFSFLGSQSLNLGSGSVSLGANATVNVLSNTLAIGGDISGGSTLTVGLATNNSGTLELSGNNSFGNLTFVSGTIALGSDTALGAAATLQFSPANVTPAATNLTLKSKDSSARTINNAISVNGFDGPYILAGTGDLIFNGNIATGNGYKRFYVINNSTFNGLITDNGAPSGQVAKDGPGTLTLTANNTTTKPFRIDAGTLALGSTTAIGSGMLTINGGGLDSTVTDLVNANNNTQTWAGNFYFAGSQNLNLGTGSVTMSANTTITVSNNTITVGGNISGSGRSLTKSGAGTLVLSGANTYSNTTVTAGTLSIAQATLTTNAAVAISNSAVLQLNFSTTNQVAALVLGGVSQPAGVYKAANSGGLITSTGALLVVPTINPNPPVVQVSVSGSTMTLAWPTNAGWILQSNSVSLSAPGAWFNYPADGSVGVTSVNITVDPAKTNVFYRMVKP